MNSKDNEIMKTIKLGFFGLVTALCLWSCEDAKFSALTGEDDIYVYLADASSNKLIDDLILGDETTNFPVNVRLNRAANHDVTVHFALFDDEMLADLNKKVNNSFKCIPAEYIEFPESVVIQEGQVSGVLNLSCKKFNMGGDKYAIPYYIASAEGASIAPTSSRFALSTTAEIGETRCWAIRSGKQDAMRLEPKSSGWGLSLSQFTLEWWVKQERMSTNNQALFWMGSDAGGIYARFGDVDKKNGWTSYYNYLQVKLPGKDQGFDTGDPWVEDKGLSSNIWYHFAVCFDGNDDGMFTLYMNGEPVTDADGKVMRHTCGLTQFTIDKMDFADASLRNSHSYMCQVRLWKKVRTQAELQKYMYVEPQYTDPDLEFYLPMNEGEGKDIHDVTGHGHDGVVGSIYDEHDGEWSTVSILSTKWPE